MSKIPYVRSDGPAAILVTLASGETIRITVDEYRAAAPDLMAYVSDRLGLSIDSAVVDAADSLLFAMAE